MTFPGRVIRTLQLMFLALIPAAAPGTAPPEAGGVLSCAPRQICGGMDRLLDGKGELRLFFPGCLAIAAPLLLFRLKREGFSRCSVEASDQGLWVRGRR